MSNAYQKPLNGYRFVEIRRGDTLQTIAARELGDGARWTDLIAFNSLIPPFIVDDISLVVPGVLLSGQIIRLPAPVPVVSTTNDPEKVFGIDVMLDKDGGISTANGDFDVADGLENLHQALKNRVDTDTGELLFHTAYGSKIRSLIGALNGPTSGLLAAQYAKSCVAVDPRVKQVNSSTAEIVGDSIKVSVELQPIVGRVIQLNSIL